jgi:hypothetical protein
MFYKRNILFDQQKSSSDEAKNINVIGEENIANNKSQDTLNSDDKKEEKKNSEEENALSQEILEQDIDNSISDINSKNVFLDDDEIAKLKDRDQLYEALDDSSYSSKLGLSEEIIENIPDINDDQQLKNLEINPKELAADLENLKKLEELLSRINDSEKDSLMSGLKGIINGISGKNSELDERKVLEIVDKKINDIESLIEVGNGKNTEIDKENNIFKTDSVGILKDEDLNKSASLDLSETKSTINTKDDDLKNSEILSKRAEMSQFNYDFIKKGEAIAKNRMNNIMQDLNDMSNDMIDFDFNEDIGEITDIEKYTERVFDIEKNDSYLINEINDLEEIISDAIASKIKMDSGEELNDGDKMNIAIIDEISRHGLKAGNKLLTEFINDGSKIDATFEKSAKNIQDTSDKFDKEMAKLTNAVERKLAQGMLEKAGISLNDLKEVSRVKDIQSEGLSENIKPEQSISYKGQNEERGM